MRGPGLRSLSPLHPVKAKPECTWRIVRPTRRPDSPTGPNRAAVGLTSVGSLAVRVLLTRGTRHRHTHTHTHTRGTRRLSCQSLSIWALGPPGSGETSVLALRRFTQPFKPLTSPDNRMNPPNVLEQLRGFDRASPQFHKHLSNFLRSEGYRSAIPNLQGEDVAWLVEYLDSVSLYTVSLSSEPKTVVGSHVRVKSREPCISRILTRTERSLRYQGSPTEITYAFKFPPGHRPPASFWIHA